LYEYDAVSRLRDSQLGDEKVRDIGNYIVKGTLWSAFEAEQPVVMLIDEIDKADIEFPNDLLRELDRMEFHVYETRQTIRAKHRPLIIITSNNEKDLPDAFLRRCFFHYIAFPDRSTMQEIVAVHYPRIKEDVLRAALDTFFALREAPGLKKKPSTSEFLDWLRLLLNEAISASDISNTKGDLPLMAGALLKNEQDLTLLQRLAAMTRVSQRR
jgi:MoxR-like ATPase